MTAQSTRRPPLNRGAVPSVPAGVLGQPWRGGPQAQLSRLLLGCRVEVIEEARSRAAGAACGIAGTSNVVDASVVVGAATRGDLVVTSDIGDLRRLRDALGVDVDLQSI